MIDADFAEFVFDDRDSFAVFFGEDAVEEGGFARAEEAGQDGNGDAGFGGHGLAIRVKCAMTICVVGGLRQSKCENPSFKYF